MRKKKPLTSTQRNKIIENLFLKYYNVLLSLATLLTYDENKADELVALLFAKLIQSSDDLLEKINSWNQQSVYRYLSKALSNLNIDLHRKNMKRKKLEESYYNNTHTDINKNNFVRSPEKFLIEKENLNAIKKAYYEALDEESKIVRVAFYLRTERGYKNKELAKKLSVSPNTIGTIFRRLRQKIKEKIS